MHGNRKTKRHRIHRQKGETREGDIEEEAEKRRNIQGGGDRDIREKRERESERERGKRQKQKGEKRQKFQTETKGRKKRIKGKWKR